MLILLIIAIGLTPAVASLIVSQYSRRLLQQNLYIAADRSANERFRHRAVRPRDPDAHYVEGIGLVIGDITCQLNARSPFIRCAPNPFGPAKAAGNTKPKNTPSSAWRHTLPTYPRHFLR
ncbi:MAG: hypothetical protein HC800_16395 [Phormidesmis sp. RL_2_1]|nr:hypothetical protein [Phormidesmis sp. RL_2_1]